MKLDERAQAVSDGARAVKDAQLAVRTGLVPPLTYPIRPEDWRHPVEEAELGGDA